MTTSGFRDEGNPHPCRRSVLHSTEQPNRNPMGLSLEGEEREAISRRWGEKEDRQKGREGLNEWTDG
jgi:hypothetical protein